MEFSVFQENAAQTIEPQATEGDTIAYVLSSAMEEMGEVAGTVREYFRTGKVDRAQLMDDLADCQWYISALAVLFHLGLDEIAQYSLDKSARRARMASIEHDVAERMRQG